MDRGTDEEWQRIKRDFSLAIDYIHCFWNCRGNALVLAELQEAGKELEANQEISFRFNWRIVDLDESHIFVTDKASGHRYHISVIYPAALYVDVYRILDDGTEVDAFGGASLKNNFIDSLFSTQ